MWLEPICASWPHDQERLLVVALFTVSHAIVLWGACGLFVLAERCGWWQSCKLPRKRKDLQPSTPANQSLNQAAIGEQVLGTVVIVPLIVYLLYPVLKQLGVEICDVAPPPLPRQLLEMAGMVVGCDFLFYWTHRALHQPPFCKPLPAPVEPRTLRFPTCALRLRQIGSCTRSFRLL